VVCHDLLEHIDLQADESVHFAHSGLSIYLHYRSADFLQRIVDLGSKLLNLIRANNRSSDSNELPEGFRSLSALMHKWATSDDGAREALIEAADRPDLLDLIATVSPQMAAINAHLDSFGDQPLDSSEIKLAQLAEAADEARRHLERDDTSPRKTRRARSM